jgi:hypothetical protein
MLKFKNAVSFALLTLLILACAATASQAQAQTTKSPAAQKRTATTRKGPGILQPQMTPNKGTYEQPADKLGMPPAAPWSASTVGAAVDGKPLAGSIATMVGEIIDYSCYLQIGKHGEKHRDCAQKCFKNGQPIGLLTKDGSIYLLMEEEHNPRRDGLTKLREKAIDLAGDVVEVTGTASKVDNQKAIFVTGLVKQ